MAQLTEVVLHETRETNLARRRAAEMADNPASAPEGTARRLAEAAGRHLAAAERCAAQAAELLQREQQARGAVGAILQELAEIARDELRAGQPNGRHDHAHGHDQAAAS